MIFVWAWLAVMSIPICFFVMWWVMMAMDESVCNRNAVMERAEHFAWVYRCKKSLMRSRGGK